jgi:hypothetical protein
MRVVFAGPSLIGYPKRLSSTGEIRFAPPAALGDVAKAVVAGADVIGLIDGVFETTAAVWHKEILYALSQGVQVLGAASMGALRAAECAPFGMIGVGAIFSAYADGRLVDDDAVAQLHGPAELDYVALTEPLVNIEATIDDLTEHGLLAAGEAAAIRQAARTTFFKERTFDAIVAKVAWLPSVRRGAIRQLLEIWKHDLKRQDAEALVRRIANTADRRAAAPATWHFAATQIWDRLLDQWKAEVAATLRTAA